MPKSSADSDLREYSTVADRITLFYQRFPRGRINTELVSRTASDVVFKALVFREETEAHPAATGWASERFNDGEINSVACLENTETSAVGRALANLGFTASAKRPGREEMEKAARARQRVTPRAVGEPSGLQEKADDVLDFLSLLALARRHGFSPGRHGVLAEAANRTPSLPLPRMRRLEQRVRTWLRRHPLSHLRVQ